MRVCVRQTAFLTVRVRAPQADLCGQDNSIEATGLPEFIEPRDDELTLFEKLHPGARISSRPPSSRVRRGMRDHTSRSVLYFTLPAGELGGFAPVAVLGPQGTHGHLGIKNVKKRQVL